VAAELAVFLGAFGTLSFGHGCLLKMRAPSPVSKGARSTIIIEYILRWNRAHLGKPYPLWF
jgi:hypothetical protein